MRRGERGSMKKVMNLKSLLFCAMLVLTLAVNTVSVQADALDYLGNTIDGSVLTNETESIELPAGQSGPHSGNRRIQSGWGYFPPPTFKLLYRITQSTNKIRQRKRL